MHTLNQEIYVANNNDKADAVPRIVIGDPFVKGSCRHLDMPKPSALPLTVVVLDHDCITVYLVCMNVLT